MKKKLRYKKRKSLLYRSNVEYGDWCINHVENCAHGCKYPCYAMIMAKRFGRIKKYSEWLCPILIENALDLLDKEIPKYKDNINFVHLCFMTDPFMVGYPKIHNMTLEIISKLNKSNIKATVLTKGILPKKLINKNRFGINNEYGITLVSLNENFRKRIEPNTAKYRHRIAALKRLNDFGLNTWVSIEPFPTPNIDENTNIEKLLKEISFVNKIVFGKLNYNVVTSKYKNKSKFYEKSAHKVIDFCLKRGIEYHIKFGTTIDNDIETTNIFNESTIQPRFAISTTI